MLDESLATPTAIPTDFGLVHPLPANTNDSLYLSASARCNDCRDQWLALMAQHPQTPLNTDWWQARARGTDVSRKAQAISLYCQHFEASCHLAFAEGTLNAEQIKVLLDLVNPPAQATTSDVLFYVETLSFEGASGQSAQLPGALVITRNTDQPVTQMLYLPSRQVPWMTFEGRNSMEDWLIQQPQLLEQLAPQASSVRVNYTALDKPELTKSAESLLARLATPAADRQRFQTVFASTADLPMPEANDDIALFGQLSPDIPFGLRHSAVRQQQAALQSLPGLDSQGAPDGPALQRLQERFDALRAAEQASTDAASALLNTDNAQQLLELRHKKGPHYAALHQARLSGLRAEADLQLTLNQISSDEQRLITTVLDAPDQARPADVVVARLELSSTDSEGDTTTTQTQELDGVLVFARPSALLPSATDSLLLYWPGRFGGLQRFASRQALEQKLFRLSAYDNARTLQLLPLAGNPFEYALQIQLHSCVQQVVHIITTKPLSSHAVQRAVELDNLREQTLARLTVPNPAARELAFAQILEQVRSAKLATGLPSSLNALSTAQRDRLKALFTSYIAAMKRSQQLLERDLPLRESFSKKAIDTRLRKDFALTQNVEVLLDIPDTTSWRKEVIAGAAPGTPQKNVLVPSQQRSKLTLAELAQSNIDQDMWNRLSLMQVEVSGADAGQRLKVKTGITLDYLRKLVTELDLAGKYETLIRETFLGTQAASVFSKEYRQECLSEPWRLMLELQGEFAVLAKHIDDAGWQVLQIASNASSREAYTANGKRIALLPAHLSAGGKDTPGEGPSTLSGVTFIVEQISGLTLLYMPDSPDGIFVRQFKSLEQARMSLFNQSLHSTMVDYLAGRALTGEFAHHVSRINQARLKKFDALIGVGAAWPATTSLAAHLLNVHMGRLLEAHRTTSRSNDALYLEHVALRSGAMFNYLKMALGVVPFVGTVIALYDAWNSANLAVAAFLRGDVGHGLAEVEAVLLSLIDAAMDVLPSVGVATGAAQAATRGRQLRTMTKMPGAFQVSTPQQARHALERFRGYEFERDISLTDLQPGREGIYRNVYRHADGDFMISNGRVYQIELRTNPHQWRLSGTSTRLYKQPIAMDETGNWNTHYAVYGTVTADGGAGGGAVLGHMADGLDPLWPAAIRRWLPRWWTDRALRRQLTLTNTAEAYSRRLDTQTHNGNSTLEHYFGQPRNQRQPLRAGAETVCANDIELAQTLYLNLEELMSFSHGRKRAQIEDIQSRCAWIIVDRSLRKTSLTQDRMLEYLDRIDQLIARSDTTPVNDIAPHLQLMAQRKEVRNAFLTDLDQLRAISEDANRWNRRITNRTQKSKMALDMATLNEKVNDANHHYLKTAHTLEVISRYEAVDDLSWAYFHVQLKMARTKLGRALLTQYQLPQVRASFTQRNKVLEDCLAVYAEFRRNLNAWSLGYPQHLDLEQVGTFLDSLEQMEELARKGIKNRTTVAPNEGRSAKQLFETEDNLLLIGEASTDTVTKQQRFTLEGVDGRTETWLPRSSGKYHLSEPAITTQPELPGDVRPMLAEARKRLGEVDTYQSKVEGHARRDMLPSDLEHMMSSEATELTTRAQNIERLSPEEPIVMQLRTRAAELTRAGRTLRIEQTLNSRTPTEGYLDYLLEQKRVDIRKEGGLRDLGKRPDGRRDFLQEYEVRDLSRKPAQTLWYAHFHYTSAKPAFNDFVKGHLKLPEQRNLGLKWQQAEANSGAAFVPIWRGDIGKPFGVKHFSGL